MANANEIRLEFKDEKSAKQYTVWMEKSGKGFDIWTAWGKITDKTPETKKKNAKLLDKENAQKEYAKLANEKMEKGYKLVKGKLPPFVSGGAVKVSKKVAGKKAAANKESVKKAPKAITKKVKKEIQTEYAIDNKIVPAFRREGRDGIFIYLFSKKINFEKINSLTNRLYTETTEDEDGNEVQDFSEYDPSIYQSDLLIKENGVSEIANEVNYSNIVKRIKIQGADIEKLGSFLVEATLNAQVIYVDDEKKAFTKLVKNKEIQNAVAKLGKDLVLFVREYDHMGDY